MDRKTLSFEDFLAAAGITKENPLPEFKPCCFVVEALDLLIYLQEDCSYASRPIAGTNMDLLIAPNGERMVGVQIWGYSELLKPPIKPARAA